MNKLKFYRTIANLTLEELHKETRLSVGYLSHLENGSRENPSAETMGKIVNVLNKNLPNLDVIRNLLCELEKAEIARENVSERLIEIFSDTFFSPLTEEQSQYLLSKGLTHSTDQGSENGETEGEG